MASLYSINQSIMDCIDMETGEILDPEKLAELQMDKHEKLRNYALVIINDTAELKAVDEQIKKFMARKKSLSSTIEYFKSQLTHELDGKGMKEAEFTISYRRSESVEVAEGSDLPPEFLVQSEPRIDKAGLKKALKAGAVIEGVSLVEKQNIQIK